jgi:hypothetical protein
MHLYTYVNIWLARIFIDTRCPSPVWSALVSELVNSDTCPRPTTGGQMEVLEKAIRDLHRYVGNVKVSGEPPPPPPSLHPGPLRSPPSAHRAPLLSHR